MSTPLPKSPYRMQAQLLTSIHRDFTMLMDQLKWHLDEYCAPCEERDEIVALLDAALKRVCALAGKTKEEGGVKRDGRSNSNPWS